MQVQNDEERKPSPHDSKSNVSYVISSHIYTTFNTGSQGSTTQEVQGIL